MRVPIWLTLTRIELAMPLVDAALQALAVGDEQVVADELDLVAEGVGEELPAVPVVFGHAVFDGDDRDIVAPSWPRTRPSAREVRSLLSDFLKTYLPSLKNSLEAGSRQMPICSPGL